MSRPTGIAVRQDHAPLFPTAIVGSRPYAYQVGEWALAGFGHTLLQPLVEPTFWLARYPITYSQFQAFLDVDDGFDNPVWWEGLAAPAQERAAPGE